MNRRLVLTALGGAAASAAWPVRASLDVDDKAPDFATQGSLGGKVFRFSLSDTLKSGPVVLYFYPAAFSQACTVEAHQFAEAVDQFKSLGATPAVDLWPFFEALAQKPLLVIRGEKSDLLTADTAARMRDAVPDMKLAIVPGVGHAPELNEPEAVAAVDQFLDSLVK